MSDMLADLEDWLENNWDPDLTVAGWWELLGLAGWAAPTYPIDSYGKGLSRGDGVLIANAIAQHGALNAPGGLGLLLAGPTIAEHGTTEQIERYVRDIVTGQKAWCQLFSEPGAGSDLAGLQARAEQDGEEWIVNGQKVWTSGGHLADLGMLIARTDSDVPKHQGISYFAIEMAQPGIDIRPLREMTGRALFNEVFLTDARVGDEAMISGKGNGWAVANSTLAYERSGLGAGGGSQSTSAARPGSVAGDLDKRAGDFVAQRPPKQQVSKAQAASTDASEQHRRSGPAQMSGLAGRLAKIAESNGAIADPTIRDDLMRLHSLGEIGRINNLRVKGARESGASIPGMANISKLSMSDLVRLQRDLGLRIVGANGMLHAYDDADRAVINEATGLPMLGVITELALFAQGPPIYGGTDQVQRNIIGERVLGLPKEPNNDRVTPFSELAKNT